MRTQILLETLDGGSIFAFGNEEGTPLCDIHEERDILMPFGPAGLIDSDNRDLGEILPLSCYIDIPLQHLPNLVVIHIDDGSDSMNRHTLAQLKQQRLEQQGKTVTQPLPGRLDEANLSIGQLDSGNSGVQVTLMLEKVQVAPALLFGIVGFQSRKFRSTGFIDIGENTPRLKIDGDIEASLLLIEVQVFDIPR